MNRRSPWLVALAAPPLAAGLFLFACSSDPTATVPAPEDAGRDRRESSTTTPPEDDAGADAATAPTACPATRAYTLACGRELLCGTTGYDRWCAQQERDLSSRQLIEAQIACSTPTRCDAKLRRDCQYARYAPPLTSAQDSLLRAFCQTCAPGDGTCTTTAIAYDADAGSDGVTDLFLAVWESSDTLAAEMQRACTGGALDAGADGGRAACEKAFGQCAGGVYVDRLPDCPK